jgi:RNA-directed DNA polymerase
MLDFDIAIAKYITDIGGLYRRYCDDIIVVVPSAEKSKAQDFIIEKIGDLKLEISKEKTEVVEFKDNELIVNVKDAKGLKRLQYLGLEFDGKNIFLRHRGLAAFQRKTARGIRGAVAWAKKEKKAVPKRRLYEKYSIYSKQNYLIYAKRAARELKSSTIASQVRDIKVMRFLKGRLKKESER